MMPEKMIPRPGNRNRASAYAAIEWKNNAITVTVTETIAEFSMKRGIGIFSSTYCRLSSVHVLGQPKSKTSSAGLRALITIQSSGNTARIASTCARIGRTLILIEASSPGDSEHQARTQHQDRDDYGGQRGGVPHVDEGEGLLRDVEH